MKVSIERSPRVRLRALLEKIDVPYQYEDVQNKDLIYIGHGLPYVFWVSTNSLFDSEKSLRVRTRYTKSTSEIEKIATALCREFNKTELIIEVQ